MSPYDLPPDTAAAVGARHFRKLILIVAAIYFSVLAPQCLHQYITCLQAVPTEANVYNGLQQRATLTYYLLWFGVAALALAAASFRRTVWLSFYLCLLLAAETVAYIYYIPTQRHLYHPPILVDYLRFEPNPFVIAVPRPGVFGAVSHDQNHRRTTINEGKVPHPKLVYVFGGSTTYDWGNADADTWPTRLSQLLGPDFAVENYGVTAFSSVENMMQSLFAFRDTAPVCAVYYEGWNDVNKSHIKDLADDYSNFLYPALVRLLGLRPWPGFLERNSVLVAYAMSTIADPPQTTASEGDWHEQDLRVSKNYRDNIHLIAAIGKNFGVRVIFIPQILDYARYAKEETPQEVAFIWPKDMKKLMGLMNEDLASAAAQSQAYFLGTPLAEKWEDGDFLDHGHFSPKGSMKFATSIADDIRRICQ
jgi:hypothetical protein